MSDIDQWELFCQFMLLQSQENQVVEDEALCACAKLIENRDLSIAVL